MNPQPDLALWMQSLAVLVLGVSLMVALAALVCRRFRSAVWQRVVWQTAILGLLAFPLCELIGLAPAIQQCLRWPAPAETIDDSAIDDETAQSLSPFPVPDDQQSQEVVTNAAALEPDPRHQSLSYALRPQAAVVGIPEDVQIKDDRQFTPSSDGQQRLAGLIQPPPLSDDLAAEAPADRIMSVSPGLEPTALWWPAWFWMLGTSLVLARCLLGHLLLVCFARRHGHSDNSQVGDTVRRIASTLGIRSTIRVIETGSLHSPMAFGLLRPTIGLPSDLDQRFTRQEQEAMIVHEVAHLAARDPFWHLSADLAVALLWWHPLAWWSRGQLKHASERAADAAVLVLEDGPQDLARCLVRLGRQIWPRPLPGGISIEGSGFRSGLGRRVAHLVNLSGAWHRSPGKWGILVATVLGPAVLVAAALLSTAWARSQATQVGEPSMKLVSRSWKHSLAGMVALAAFSPGGQAVLADDERPREGDRPVAERREGERDGARREGERRDGDRPAAERRDGDRPAAERRDGDRPPPRRDGDRPADARREGDRPPPRRDGDRPPGERREGERDGDRRPDVRREGEGGPQRGLALDLERNRVAQQIERLQAQLREQAAAGRRDEAERTEREIGELRRRLEELGRRREGEGPRRDGEGPRPPFGRGLDRPRPDGPRPDGPRPGAGMEPLMRVLQELRSEIGRLREEVGDLRSRVNALTGEYGRGDRSERFERPERRDGDRERERERDESREEREERRDEVSDR